MPKPCEDVDIECTHHENDHRKGNGTNDAGGNEASITEDNPSKASTPGNNRRQLNLDGVFFHSHVGIREFVDRAKPPLLKAVQSVNPNGLDR